MTSLNVSYFITFKADFKSNKYIVPHLLVPGLYHETIQIQLMRNDVTDSTVVGLYLYNDASFYLILFNAPSVMESGGVK